MGKWINHVMGVPAAVALGLIASRFSLAASHDISACLHLEDDRYFNEYIGGNFDFETRGERIPLIALPIRIEYEALGMSFTARGDVTTGSDGCFSAELSGAAVPRETVIRLKTLLKNDDVRVYESGEGTISMVWDEKRVTGGRPHAHFGTITAAAQDSRGNRINTPLFHWANVQTLKKKYSDHVQPWRDARFKQLDIEWPAPEGVAGGRATGGRKITLSDSVRSNFAYFFHEWGHWVNQNQARTGVPAGYCYDRTSSSFPKSVLPYLYWDPNGARAGGDGDCSHGYDNPEEPEMAFVEGIADFTASALFFDGKCEASVFDDRELVFDGQSNERTVHTTLCDLRDEGLETRSALHVYHEAGAMRQVASGSSEVPRPFTEIQDSQGDTLVAGNTDRPPRVLEIPLGEDATPEHLREHDFSAELGKTGILRAVAVSEAWICATIGRQTACKNRGVLAAVQRLGVPSPSSTFDIKDLRLLGDRLYVMGVDSALGQVELRSAELSRSVIRPDPLGGAFRVELSVGSWSAPHWQERYLGTGTESRTEYLPKRFSVAYVGGELRFWFSRTHWVETCVLSDSKVEEDSCLNGSVRFAGQFSNRGYQRGARLIDTVFQQISHLRVGHLPHLRGTQLFVFDQYGVAAVPVAGDGETRSEQAVGAGYDRVFVNNLSLRSMAFINHTSVGNFWFGTNHHDKAVLIGESIQDWNHQRYGASARRWFELDLDSDRREQVYCGSENSQVSLKKILHGTDGYSYYESLSYFLETALGLSSRVADSIKETNFAKLNSSGCEADQYRESYVRESAGRPFDVGSPRPSDGVVLAMRGEETPRFRLPINVALPVRHSPGAIDLDSADGVLPPSDRLSPRLAPVLKRSKRLPDLKTRTSIRNLREIPKIKLMPSDETSGKQ